MHTQYKHQANQIGYVNKFYKVCQDLPLGIIQT